MWKLKIKTDMMDHAFELYAEEVDFMHVPLVTIKGIQPEKRSALIALPDSDVYAEFSKFSTLIIPYNYVQYAGLMKEEEVATARVVRALPTIKAEESDGVT
jgi:hypothetical protein